MARRHIQSSFSKTFSLISNDHRGRIFSIFYTHMRAEGSPFGPFLVALGLWLLIMIATPIGIWVGGTKFFPLFASLGVIAQAAATLLALASSWTRKRLLFLFGLVVFFTWTVEWVGSNSGWPFGDYHYTDSLQPQVFGVPVLIPLAWWMMLAPSWAMAIPAFSPARRGKWFWIKFSLLSGLAFTAWDLYLDPQMVAREVWIWNQPGLYYGVPVQNYLGWILTATLLTILVRPTGLPARRLALIYTLTWLFQAVGQGIFWGQPGPAFFGFLGMGVFALAYWLREYNSILSEMQSSSLAGGRQ